MLWVPQKGILRVQHNLGAVGVASPGTSVTTGATASTKGTPAEIFAATSFDAYYVKIMAVGYGVTSGASEGAFDLLIGAATEKVLIANMLMGYCGGDVATANSSGKVWEFPLYIPAGSRLAVQAAGARTATAFQVSVFLYGGSGYPPFRVGGKVTTYGMGTVPNGTTIAPGSTGAEGAWTQITAATTEDHFAFAQSIQPQADTALAGKHLMVDLGEGAATENQFAEGYWYTYDGNERMYGPFFAMPAFRDIPSGTRLVMRASCSGTPETQYGAVIHAVS